MSQILFTLSKFFVLFGVAAHADPLNGTLELGATSAHFYDARSVFLNPAALAYQTELNGPALLSSHGIGINSNDREDFTFGLSYSGLGFGAERLNSSVGSLGRYSFVAAMPVTHQIFVGVRYALYRSASTTLGDFNSLDIGFQYHISPWLSFGAQANNLTQAGANGATGNIQSILGVLARPIEKLDLFGDIDTPSKAFFAQVGYQFGAAYEIFRGFKVRAGYHKDYKYQLGIQLGLGNTLLSSSIQPESQYRKVTLSAQFSPTPFRSVTSKSHALRIKVDGSLDESGEAGSLFIRSRPAFIEVIDRLESVKDNPFIDKVVIHMPHFPLGVAAAADFGEAISRLRKTGKQVEAVIGHAGIREFLALAQANKIVMEPEGELRFLGFKTERYFLKGTLDKLGVEGEFIARGEFKSAPEMFTRKESSPASKESDRGLLTESEKNLLIHFEKSKRITREKWKKLTETALLSPEEALKEGLVDEIATASQYIERVRKENGFAESLEESRDLLALPDRIAVVVTEGDILDAKNKMLSLGGFSQVTPSATEKKLRAAEQDARTKAIVLRVSSPGGEILASREIASVVEQVGKSKPVIVSMGDVAASGGYFIAAPGKRIFAQDLTYTGSIGVFLGKVNFKELFKKIELKKEIISFAPFASLYSEDHKWEPRELSILNKRADQYYSGFTKYVSEKRKLALSEVESSAKGRVWLGSQALTMKLIDETTGLRGAIEFAIREGNAKHSEIWNVQLAPGLFQIFGEDGWFTRSQFEGSALPSLLPKTLWRELGMVSSLQKTPFLFWETSVPSTD